MQKERPVVAPQDHGKTGSTECDTPLDKTGTASGRPAIDGLQHEVGTYLLLVDPDALVVILGVVAAQRLQGDTPWLMVVGPSSGAKTELLSLLRGVETIFELSDLTDKTLASGLTLDPGESRASHPNAARPGLLERLSNEILVFKDFTTVLSMNRDRRQKVLAQLREVYDGKFDGSWGTGKELHWKGRLAARGESRLSQVESDRR